MPRVLRALPSGWMTPTACGLLSRDPAGSLHPGQPRAEIGRFARRAARASCSKSLWGRISPRRRPSTRRWRRFCRKARPTGSTIISGRRRCRTSRPAFREYPLRAFVVGAGHRPCADHRGGDGGARSPRGLLRQDRRAARHGAEPCAATSLPFRDRATEHAHGRCHSRREGAGLAGAQAHFRGRSAHENRARPIYPLVTRWCAGAGLCRRAGRESGTETFVSLRCELETWRWAGVPIFLRTGKRMGSRYSEIVVTFRKLPHLIFPGQAGAAWRRTDWSSACSRMMACNCR